MTSLGSVEIGGETFAYLESGSPDRPLVLCAHGFPDYPGTYRHLLPALASSGFRAVAPYLRGYAPSTLRGPYDMAQIAADLSALARTLSPERRVVLVGHDWGAVATYWALARFPETFCRAVTLAVPHPATLARNARQLPGQMRRSWYMFFFQVPVLSERVLARNDFALVDRLYREWSPGFVPDAGSLAEVKRCLAASLPAPIRYYRAALRPTRASYRAFREVARTPLTVPTLYLHGARDGLFPYAMSRSQERRFKGGFESELLSGVGHFLHLEDPQRVNQKILDFIEPALQG